MQDLSSWSAWSGCTRNRTQSTMACSISPESVDCQTFVERQNCVSAGELISFASYVKDLTISAQISWLQRYIKLHQSYASFCFWHVNDMLWPGKGEWGEWGDWSTCGTTCSAGSSVRRRTCRTEPCRGDSIEAKDCKIGECPGLLLTITNQ